MLALAGLGGSMLSLCRVILGLQIIKDVWSKCWPLIINVGPEHEDGGHLHQNVQNDNMVLGNARPGCGMLVLGGDMLSKCNQMLALLQ